MSKFALIGKKLGHSFSKRYFEQKWGGNSKNSYELLEMPSLESLRAIVAEHRLDGFNVTVPYKEAIIPLLDELDPVAREIGAVNCVKVCYASSPACGNFSPHTIYLKGYNTDAPAFLETLKRNENENENSLILGTGGAAKAVAWALRQSQIPYRFVSRHPELHPNAISYDEATKQFTIQNSKFKIHNSKFTILINATPVGMWPDTDASPWLRPDLLTEHTLCYDLIYNPSPTLFLQQAAQQGATTIDGLQMLHRQADLSYQLWSKEKTLKESSLSETQNTKKLTSWITQS